MQVEVLLARGPSLVLLGMLWSMIGRSSLCMRAASIVGPYLQDTDLELPLLLGILVMLAHSDSL
jgi:hypothetical protein